MSQMCPCAFSRAPSCAMNGTCARGAHAGAYTPRRSCATEAGGGSTRSSTPSEHSPAERRAQTRGSLFGSRAPSATSPPAPRASAWPSAAATVPAPTHSCRSALVRSPLLRRAGLARTRQAASASVPQRERRCLLPARFGERRVEVLALVIWVEAGLAWQRNVSPSAECTPPGATAQGAGRARSRLCAPFSRRAPCTYQPGGCGSLGRAG